MARLIGIMTIILCVDLAMSVNVHKIFGKINDKSNITKDNEIDRADSIVWSYATKNNWHNEFPAHCAALEQSPINLDQLTSHHMGIFGWAHFKFYDYDKTGTTTAENDGHTLKLTFTGVTPKVDGGRLDWGRYQLAQYHFHWGSNNLVGAEHTIATVKYPLELHLVHYKDSYSSLGDALGKDRGIAVFGVLFEISNVDNPNLLPITSKITSVIQKGQTTTITNPPKFEDLLPSAIDRRDFFTYKGSLTTPKCNEGVIWSVFRKPLPISGSQMNEFRKMLDAASAGNVISNNYRPIQPLNNRRVERSFD